MVLLISCVRNPNPSAYAFGVIPVSCLIKKLNVLFWPSMPLHSSEASPGHCLNCCLSPLSCSRRLIGTVLSAPSRGTRLPRSSRLASTHGRHTRGSFATHLQGLQKYALQLPNRIFPRNGLRFKLLGSRSPVKHLPPLHTFVRSDLCPGITRPYCTSSKPILVNPY